MNQHVQLDVPQDLYEAALLEAPEKETPSRNILRCPRAHAALRNRICTAVLESTFEPDEHILNQRGSCGTMFRAIVLCIFPGN